MLRKMVPEAVGCLLRRKDGCDLVISKDGSAFIRRPLYILVYAIILLLNNVASYHERNPITDAPDCLLSLGK